MRVMKVKFGTRYVCTMTSTLRPSFLCIFDHGRNFFQQTYDQSPHQFAVMSVSLVDLMFYFPAHSATLSRMQRFVMTANTSMIRTDCMNSPKHSATQYNAMFEQPKPACCGYEGEYQRTSRSLVSMWTHMGVPNGV